MGLFTRGKSPCPWCHGRIFWNRDDLSSVSPLSTSIFIFQHVWSWHYFHFVPFLVTIWMKPHPVPNLSGGKTLLCLSQLDLAWWCRWWKVFSTWSRSTGWGAKRLWWVHIIVRMHRLVSSCVGDTPISLNGVLQHFNSPSNGSLFSAEAFLRMRFVSVQLFPLHHLIEDTLLSWWYGKMPSQRISWTHGFCLTNVWCCCAVVCCHWQLSLGFQTWQIFSSSCW